MGLSFILSAICILNFHHFLAAENPNPANDTLSTYIIHLEPNSHTTDLESFYDSFVPSPSTTSQTDGPRIIYRYRDVFTGLAAKLSAKDVEAMQQKKGFVWAHKERVFPLLTTHSPYFLGLNQNDGFWKTANYGKGVIVGVLDTGVTPDHPSFSGEGIPPPPQKWKGKCGFTSEKACNNKLIGARPLAIGSQPNDTVGHGTHTASTAAGNYVKDANIFGLANGTASGVAPLAHVAIYQVCDPSGCFESDIIAGLDAAISDGVDIISMSLGIDPRPFYADSTAVAAFAAIKKGIFVSCAAGNSGPFYKTLSNEAPWVLTVGASTQDRTLDVAIVLGDNTEIYGQSAFQPKGSDASTKKLELAIPDTINCEGMEGRYEGKIVVCQTGGSTRIKKGENVKEAGGAAMIVVNAEMDGEVTYAEAHVLPAAHIGYQAGLKLKAYVNSTKPVASLQFKGTHIGDKNAPIVATFSSRGPNAISPGILKPDILGPGVVILAAWNTPIDNSSTKPAFNIISGTSMSTPHLSGVAALLKSAHPDWSPAAIKSAIITTAQPLNLDKKPIVDQTLNPANTYTTGAGLVNPSLATNPGLIYELKPEEYIPYLCGLNYTTEQVGTIVQQKVDCEKEPKISQAQLNYPSFSVVFGSSSQTYTRTVTNVGEANSMYEVKIESPQSVTIKVEPPKLTFTKAGEQKSYNVTFTKSSNHKNKDNYGWGSITWNSEKNVVRSPIGFIFN